ncbi:MAG: RnfABCDGE type electron transport complex subunit G [Bacteroidales bacterium]|jgi:electron transport complex protein RnfG|nr:RnfABCDGE type electron transport complex subunit G [Bacteroidales bacterium]
MVVCLFLICFVCSGLLAVVNALTEAPIAEANVAKINASIAAVVPTFDNEPSSEVFQVTVGSDAISVYPATLEGALVGYAVETFSNKGFGGRITLMVGFQPDGTVYNTSVVSHAETPGLGDKMDASKSNFSEQFKGIHPSTFRLAVKKDGGDIDAITASTITSRAFADAVSRAYEAFLLIENDSKEEM